MLVEGILKLLPHDLMLFLIQINEQTDDRYITESAALEGIERYSLVSIAIVL